MTPKYYTIFDINEEEKEFLENMKSSMKSCVIQTYLSVGTSNWVEVAEVVLYAEKDILWLKLYFGDKFRHVRW